MKRSAAALAAGVIMIACTGFAVAAIARFEGKWKNVDPRTRGLTAPEIRLSGETVKVHAWGKCHPTDCDWGTVDATPYAPDVGTGLPGGARTLLAIFTTDFSQTVMVIDPDGEDAHRVECLTRFKDKGQRSAGSEVSRLSR